VELSAERNAANIELNHVTGTILEKSEIGTDGGYYTDEWKMDPAAVFITAYNVLSCWTANRRYCNPPFPIPCSLP
jgi:hypothetical protein